MMNLTGRMALAAALAIAVPMTAAAQDPRAALSTAGRRCRAWTRPATKASGTPENLADGVNLLVVDHVPASSSTRPTSRQTSIVAAILIPRCATFARIRPPRTDAGGLCTVPSCAQARRDPAAAGGVSGLTGPPYACARAWTCAPCARGRRIAPACPLSRPRCSESSTCPVFKIGGRRFPLYGTEDQLADPLDGIAGGRAPAARAADPEVSASPTTTARTGNGPPPPGLAMRPGPKPLTCGKEQRWNP